jgi:predicted SnoaL-like aldol condensation-catalyzing enzyme
MDAKKFPRRLSAGMILFCAAPLLQAVAPTTPVTLPMTLAERANLQLVQDWWRIVIWSGHLEFVPKYQAETYIQHNPGISTGRAAFLKVFSVGNKPTNPIPDKTGEDVPLAGARGDFVWFMREFKHDDPKDPSLSGYGDGFDLLRVDHGQIQEHWDVATRDKTDDDGVVYGKTPKPLSDFAQGDLSPAERANRAVAIEAAEDVYARHRSAWWMIRSVEASALPVPLTRSRSRPPRTASPSRHLRCRPGSLFLMKHDKFTSTSDAACSTATNLMLWRQRHGNGERTRVQTRWWRRPCRRQASERRRPSRMGNHQQDGQ